MNKLLLLTGVIIFGLTGNAQNAGSLDLSFGVEGKVITSVSPGSDKANSVILQPDGKIVIAGVTTSPVTGKDFVCIRYNTDGTLDTSFGTDGIVTTDMQTGSDDVAYSIALQNDGKIVLGGYSDDGSQKKAAIIRYNTDGSIDSTFGAEGKVLTSFEEEQASEIKVLKIHALTGNIIVGGNTMISTTKAKPVVARYLSSGTLDTDFNETGIRLLWVNTNDNQYLMTIEDLVVQTNGKVSAVGWRDFSSMPYSNNHWACRINANGTMDTTFSTNGVNTYNGTFNGNDRSFSMLLKSDNSFVVAGSSDISGQSYAYTLFEITPGGSIGPASTQISIPFYALDTSFPYSLKEDNNGKYLLVGSTGSATNRTFAIVRINPDYTIDNSFDSDGKVTTSFGTNALNEAFGSVIQPDNKIIAVGYTGNDIAIARYLGIENLSVNEFENKNIITVYPNPVKDVLQIEFINDNVVNASFQIIDLNGRVLVEGNLTSQTTKIDITNLSKGVYVVKTNKFTRKFVKE